MRFVFIYLFCISVYAQDVPVVFVDENFDVVPENVFKQKQNTPQLFDTEIVTDSVIYKKLYYKKYFGTLDADKKSQLNKLLYQRYKVDTTKVWVIHYKESLPDVRELPRGNSAVYSPIDNTNASKNAAKFLNRTKTFYSKEEYMNAAKLTTHEHPYRHWHNNTKLEYKRYSKVPETQLMHFYERNDGYPNEDGIVKWYKDPYKIIQTLFFEASQCYSSLIVHPDGTFFVSYNPLGFAYERAFTDKVLFDKSRK